jgi:cytochrome c553
MATPNFPIESYQALIDKAVSSVGKTNAVTVCSACHGTNGVSGVERKCLVCHDSMDKLHFYKGTSSRTQSFHDFNGNGKLDDADCLVCHWQPDMDGIVEPDTDFGAPAGVRPKTVEKLCLSCHSPTGGALFKGPVADTDGDGKPDRVMSPKEPPPDVAAKWMDDYHGADSYTSGERAFKNISLSGELLFHTDHAPLACSVCHNPHASNNDKLIIERVGETLLAEKIVKQADNTEEVKFALVDPQTLKFFKDMSFSGTVEAKERTYDLSKGEDLKAYSQLPVKNLDGVSVDEARALTSSLCAACHDGEGYSPVNGLSVVDIKTHKAGSACTTCHTHGGSF